MRITWLLSIMSCWGTIHLFHENVWVSVKLWYERLGKSLSQKHKHTKQHFITCIEKSQRNTSSNKKAKPFGWFSTSDNVHEATPHDPEHHKRHQKHSNG